MLDNLIFTSRDDVVDTAEHLQLRILLSRLAHGRPGEGEEP